MRTPRSLSKFLEAWRASAAEPDDEDEIIEVLGRRYIRTTRNTDCEEFELISLEASEHAQRLRELLNLLKDPLEEMWQRPCLLDTDDPELAGEW